MLLLTFVLSLVCSLVAGVQFDQNALSGLPFLLFVSPRGWQGVDAAVYSMTIPSRYGSWGWAMFQWTAYHGAYLTLGLWLVLLGTLYFRRVHKLQRNATVRPQGFRLHLGGLAQPRTVGVWHMPVSFGRIPAPRARCSRTCRTDFPGKHGFCTASAKLCEEI